MRRKPRRTKRLANHGYDHLGDVALGFAIGAIAFLSWLFMQNQEFLEECARYGGC